MKTILTIMFLFATTFYFSQNASESDAKNRIEDIYTKLVSGQFDFATAATLYSEDIDSAKKGGLWEINKTSGDKDIDKAITKLKANEISKPFKIKNGYHIIQVLEKTEPGKIKILHVLITFTEEEE